MTILSSERPRKPHETGRRQRPRFVHGAAPPRLPGRIFAALVLLVCCLGVIFPFVSVVATSLAPQEDIARAGGFVLWTNHPTFNAYESILAGGAVLRALLVSIGITVVGTAISLLCTIMLAYALSRSGSLLHRPILLLVLFSILFTPGLIPLYLMVKQLGLLDSYWSLILPVAINGFNVIIMRSFFLELPAEILDSAKIDGASETRILWSIVLPLSKAVVAVVGLFYAVSYWNHFFNAVLYLNDTTKWPLQLLLRTYVVDNTVIADSDYGATVHGAPPQQSLQMAMLIMALVPIALVYPFLQKHFARGALVGAVKG